MPPVQVFLRAKRNEDGSAGKAAEEAAAERQRCEDGDKEQVGQNGGGCKSIQEQEEGEGRKEGDVSHWCRRCNLEGGSSKGPRRQGIWQEQAHSGACMSGISFQAPASMRYLLIQQLSRQPVWKLIVGLQAILSRSALL